jgi:serine/threonine-protein kinase RsbW
MSQKRLDLVFGSTFEELDCAVEALQEFIPTIELDDDLAYRVILLASEALTNAMEHGNQWDENKNATLSLVKDGNLIEVVVTDEGKGIHWTQHDPLTESNQLADHGRGQFFMSKMADEIHVEGDGCRLRLVFYCQS